MLRCSLDRCKHSIRIQHYFQKKASINLLRVRHASQSLIQWWHKSMDLESETTYGFMESICSYGMDIRTNCNNCCSHEKQTAGNHNAHLCFDAKVIHVTKNNKFSFAFMYKPNSNYMFGKFIKQYLQEQNKLI